MVEFKRPDAMTWVVEGFVKSHTLTLRVVGHWVELRLDCVNDNAYEIRKTRRRHDDLKCIDFLPYSEGCIVTLHFEHVVDFKGDFYSELKSVDFESEDDAEQFADTIQAAFDLASTYARR